MSVKENPVLNKSFQFALKIIGLYKHLTNKHEYVLSKQVLRSGTSIGANVEEGVAGISKKDFISKMSIACKEARETKYWLRLIHESKINEDIEIAPLIKEADELVRILTAIIKTSQTNHS